MRLIKEIPLANGLKVEVWDKSISIAADTTKVELLIRSKVELRSSYFTKPEHFELVRKVLGPEIFFEYKKERPFVNNKKKTRFSKNCWMLSREILCHTCPNLYSLAISLCPSIGIYKKTGISTIPISRESLPEEYFKKGRDAT